MPVWGFAKKSVRVFLNFSFGQFLSQPLSDEQVSVTAKGVGCKDIYLNIKKINAILAERGIPIVLCVAYISEMVICLPWKIELNGVDFVVQASPDCCRPVEDDSLLNSMISSMTAAAFAAAKVADGSRNWFQTYTDDEEDETEDGDEDLDDENTLSDEGSRKTSGLISRIQQFFERLTKTAEKVNFDENKADSIVDQDSKERVVYMIDSLIAQTTVVLCNVSLRLECQLGLPGLNRASGITLLFRYLSLSNQSSTSPHPSGGQHSELDARDAKDAHGKFDSQTDVNSHDSDGWSWLWPWGNKRKQASQTMVSPQIKSTSTSGSLSTMLHKIIRLEEADVMWDLWDSTPKRNGSRRQRHGSHSTTNDDDGSVTSESIRIRAPSYNDDDDDEASEVPIPGPTEENMVASSKLLTLPGGEHTARVSMRCPLFALATHSSGTSAPNSSGGFNSSTDSWSSFELRVHLDLGPIVACACPSQFYWLQLIVGQLNHIWQVYQDVALTRSSSSSQPETQHAVVSRVADPGDLQRFPHSQMALYEQCMSPNPLESELVDLDLSGPNDNSESDSRACIDSRLFWSCMTDVPEDANNGDTDGMQAYLYSNSTNASSSATPGPAPTADPKFSLAANVLCCALVVFYEDESVFTVDESSVSPTVIKTGSSPTGANSFRRTMMMQSTVFEPTRSNMEPSRKAEADNDEESTLLDSTLPNSDEPMTSSPTAIPTTPCTSQKMVALPGPFEFFARFHGRQPWRQPQLNENTTPTGQSKRSRSNISNPSASSFVHLTGPMRIDRSEVDTGQMTPSVWVSHLRRQFAELASPRDHLCFVGGLWHVEFCARSHTPPTRPGLPSRSDVIYGSSTEFSAQLFGLELSECLFPDPMVGDSTQIEPSIYGVICFPDRLRGSNDRVGRIVSDQTAIKLSGLVRHLSHTGSSTRSRQTTDQTSWPRATNWNTSQNQTSTLLSGLIELACCRIDVDLSLTDRVHRITDAIAAASEAVSKFTVWSMSDSVRLSPEWRGATPGANGTNLFPDEMEGMDMHFRPRQQPVSSLEPGVAHPTDNYPGSSIGERARSGLVSNTDFKLACTGFEILLRFPIPLEAIKLEGSQQLSDLRKSLWSSGTSLWFSPTDPFSSETESRTSDRPSMGEKIGLAWWRRTLRPEHLRIGLDKVTLSYQAGPESISDGTGEVLSGRNRGAVGTNSLFGPKLTGMAQTIDKKNEVDGEIGQQIQLSLRSVVVHWFQGRSKVQPAPLIHLSNAAHVPTELITIVFRLTTPGRTELVEEPSDPHVQLDEFSPSQPVYAYSRQRFEMGVDLANWANSGTGTSAVEWSLWKRAGPKQNLRTPFVIRRNFLQDAPKMHSKQTTYYPGDANHLSVYRQSACLHTRLYIRCTIPVFLLQVENKRTMELTYTRLMYDLLLWNSLLPSDRRLRATLLRRTRTGTEPASTKLRDFDHCHWFLSDPAPLASIYAHPEAAREAANREAISSTGLRQAFGLHFHPLYSDDDDEDEEEEEEGYREKAAVGDAFYDFDPAVDSACNDSRPAPRIQSGSRRNKNTRSRNRARTHSSSSDDPGPVTEGATTIQRQSQCAIHLDVGTVEARFTIPSRNVTGKPDQVRLVGSHGIAFAEIGHDGATNLNFITTELAKFDIFVSPGACSGDSNPANEGGPDCATHWWPCLLRVSWPTIGYPVNQTLSGSISDHDTHIDPGPMFTMAIEHRQSQRPHPISDVPVYRDDIILAVRIQDTCLAHWPQLEPTWDTGSSCTGLPSWLTRFMLLLETPSVPLVTLLWPGYQLTDTLLIQHVHLERVLFTWGSPDVDPGSPNPCSYVIPSLRSARALIGCESISVAVNTASEAPLTPVTDNTGNQAANTTPSPGMLIMSYLSNAAVFVCPILCTVSPGLEHLQSILTPNATTNSPSGFLKWLSSLKMTDCVCVADLDHMELRLFSDPMRNPADDPSSPSYLTRTDVRSTNNLLRLHTCPDTLAALQILVQALIPLDPGPSPATGARTHTESGGTGPSVAHADSPTYPIAKCTSKFSSRSSLRSDSPRCLNQRSSLGNCLTSGSGSSVEDLLQGAISDVNSPYASPCKVDDANSQPKSRERLCDIRGPARSHSSPERRPCPTKRPIKPVPMALYPQLDDDELPAPNRVPSPALQPSSSSSDSSLPEFVVVKPSMVPSRSVNPFGSREQIRCLVPPTGPCTSEVSHSGDAVPSSCSPCGFELNENHYPMPTGLSASAGTRNRMHRLFTDPPSVYPRANMAVTLYNFSVEWNIYGGLDLIQSQSTGGVGAGTGRASPQPNPTSTLEHKYNRPGSSGSGSIPVGIVENRTHSTKGGIEVSSGAAKIAGLQPGVRFRHSRPASAMLVPTPMGSQTTSGPGSTSVTAATGVRSTSPIPVRIVDPPMPTVSLQELYTRGGRCRDASKCIAIRLNNLYFRHSAFPDRGRINRPADESTATTDPASRYVLNIGSLIIVDHVASSLINQLLYTFTPSATSGSAVPHSVDTPMLRAAVVCWRVPTDRTCATGPVPTDKPSSTDSTSDLELEAKVSVQPLRINIDQNTLRFLEEFQQMFSSFTNILPEMSESPAGVSHMIPQPVISERSLPQGCSANSLDEIGGSEPVISHRCAVRGSDDGRTDTGSPIIERPGVFIRKVTFYPDLLIRLDYHGRHLDWTVGSFQGFLRMLLRLNNGELIIPRRVYQRGYPNFERLLDEVMADLRVTIASQLPQLIATSLGPMHEVRLFLMGLWDLVYQPVHGVCQGSWDSGRSKDPHRGQWCSTEWDLSTCDMSTGTGNLVGMSPGTGAGGFIQGLRRGTRSFSTSTLWATLQLSIQSVRAVQSIAETTYDLVTPGPALRSRQLRLRQPADLREGFGNAMNAMTRGLQIVTEDLCVATRLQSEIDLGYKGPVGMVGDVLRQIPPTIVAPVVAGCEIAANILGGFRNQLRPEAKIEDEQKWKDTHGL